MTPTHSRWLLKSLVNLSIWLSQFLNFILTISLDQPFPSDQEGNGCRHDDHFIRTSAGPVDDLMPRSFCFLVQNSVFIRAKLINSLVSFS